MAKTVNTGWRLVTPGDCKNCGNDSDYGCDGRDNVLCSCHPEFDESFDTTEAGATEPVEYPETVLALAAHLECEPGELEVSLHDETLIEHGSAEYRVLTESERETAASEALDSYIDDCLEIPAAIEPYFDRDKWKRDALLSDGYGHTLSGYDGDEHEEQVNGSWYFIYRQN